MHDIPRFTDIHCHLLPAIDDGAGNDDVALAMARMAVADGITTIIATPHQMGGYANILAADIRAIVARFQARLAAESIPLAVLPGADVRIEVDLFNRLRRGEIMTLADRGRHVLLELPHEVYLSLDRLLSALNNAGITGILSHPERNAGILAQPAVLRALRRSGCLLQITAGSLLGAFGSRVRSFSEGLIQQRLVDFIATDAHDPHKRVPKLADAFRRIAALTDETFARTLCCDNPALVVQGKSVAPSSRASGWFGWSKAA
jgi:protein-tyrosine phosphatase